MPGLSSERLTPQATSAVNTRPAAAMATTIQIVSVASATRTADAFSAKSSTSVWAVSKAMMAATASEPSLAESVGRSSAGAFVSKACISPSA